MARNIRYAPSSHTLMGVAHARVAKEKISVTQNIRLAPSSRAISFCSCAQFLAVMKNGTKYLSLYIFEYMPVLLCYMTLLNMLMFRIKCSPLKKPYSLHSLYCQSLD